ncbi:contact-dependent growth inhibition system immunity protein [Clostridium beijerinckii]|uniref:contact-dependent growth inhibition system immunity protein n=1 Tax=Clostridium beijerinckii TaxID=1520 RepID=UPI0005A342A7|nr:contact-dependent growth inhibition system immunity protein [Clostridium beijerinckii]
MYSSNETISKILNVKSEEIDMKCELDKWYVTLLNKTIEEININDISRMLRQDILIEVAINKSVEILNENPLAGEMYDGQLLELLYSVDINKYKEDIDEVKDILIKIKSNVSSFEWMCDEDFKEYLDVLEKYLKKIS